jgi:membrane-bound lytic murein transglycosylase B
VSALDFLKPEFRSPEEIREGIATVTGQQPPKTPKGYLGRAGEGVAKAAHKYGVNPAYLWGIYGTETSYGSNIARSAAGAEGPFQFLPSTAREYGYPLTANLSGHVTDWTVFDKQAEAAAKLLVAYGYKRNPRRAIESYNAGPASPAGSARTYYESVVRHAQTYARVGPAGSDAVAKEKITEEGKSPGGLKVPGGGPLSGLVGELLAGAGGLLVTGVLLIAGMVLVAFGIFTALKPRAA